MSESPSTVGQRVMRALHALFALVFALCVVVQVNDPDPLLWMAVYAAGAAIAGLRAANRRLHVELPAIVFVISAIWAGYLATIVFGGEPFTPMFGDAIEGSVILEAEEGREMGGG